MIARREPEVLPGDRFDRGNIGKREPARNGTPDARFPDKSGLVQGLAGKAELRYNLELILTVCELDIKVFKRGNYR